MKTLTLILASCFFVVLLTCKPVIAQNNTKDPSQIESQNKLKGFIKSDISINNLHFNFQYKNYLRTQTVPMQQMDSIIYKYWNGFDWVNDEKGEFKYDINGNNILWTYLGWDETYQQWQNSYKVEIGFDSSGNPIIFISYEWGDGIDQWFKGEKTEITYDLAGNITIVIEFEWDEDAEEWVAVYREENTFGEDGNIILTHSFEWNESTSQWENSAKVDYTYDANGNEIIQIIYGWDEQWVGSEKMENAYDANGNLTEEVFFSWEYNQWKKEFKSVYIYNADDKPTLETGYHWYGNSWVPEVKCEKNYDTNGNNILKINYLWEGNAGQFTPYSKYELVYNYTYGIDELILPYIYYVFEMNLHYNMLTNKYGYYYDQDAMLWVEDDLDIYYFSEVDFDAINEQTVTDIKLYPNPSNGLLTISWENNYSEMNLEIFDVMGSVIINKQIINNSTISLDYLAKGMYFYRMVDSNNELYKGKLILK